MKTNNYNGYIKLWRKSIESDVFLDSSVWKVWTWCLMKANHEYQKIFFAGREIELFPGQFITGRFKAVEELGDISIDVWRRSVLVLRRTTRITVKSTNKYSLFTVINWPIYQNRDKLTPPKTPPMTPPKTPTNPQQTPTDKNDKNRVITEVSKETSLPSEEEKVVACDEDGNEVSSRKKKTSKDKVAIRVVNKFADMCSKEIGGKFLPDINNGYFIVLRKMKDGLTEEDIYDIFEDWFKQGKSNEDTIMLRYALSVENINRFKARQ